MSVLVLSERDNAMLSRWRSGFIILGILIIAVRALAQSDCPVLVQDALDSVLTSCNGVGRNQVCYGNLSLHATQQPDAPTFKFDAVGDIVDVTHLQTLKLDALDETRGVWGLAMMQLQANIPDTLPGQNVTFLMFGDVEIENTAAADQNPMQAFYLRSGVGDADCQQAPESGVLIQTPHGVKSVSFNINGVDIEVGSTIMLQAQPAGDFTIRTLEGAAVVTMNGRAYPVIAGTEMSLPLDDQLHASGLPSMPVPLSETVIESLPLAPLPRAIPPAAPLSDAAMMKLTLRLDAGLEPCGVPGLPACEHALEPDDERVWATEANYCQTVADVAATSDIAMLPTATLNLPDTNGVGNPTANGVITLPPVSGGNKSDAPGSQPGDSAIGNPPISNYANPEPGLSEDNPVEKGLGNKEDLSGSQDSEKDKKDKEKRDKEDKEKRDKEDKEKKDKKG